jgi:hypothetical protein
VDSELSGQAFLYFGGQGSSEELMDRGFDAAEIIDYVELAGMSPQYRIVNAYIRCKPYHLRTTLRQPELTPSVIWTLVDPKLDVFALIV